MSLRKVTAISKTKGHRTALSRLSCSIVGNTLDLAIGRFPNTVRIETTNACNAKCVICPHQVMQRPTCNIDDELYRRIIDECAESGCRNIHLHNFGEPLLDKHLTERVRYAKQKGIKKITIFSNGSLLTTEKAEQLIDAGLDEIKVSFDGATKEEFEKIRVPLKFDAIVGQIKELVSIRNRKKAPLKIKVACCSTSDKNETMRLLENCVDDFSFGKVHNWADKDVNQPIRSDTSQGGACRSGIRKPCSRVWQTFTVLSNGKVALCCLDYEGKIDLGNVSNKTISEIWTSESYKMIRLLHKKAQQDKISICRNCIKSFW